MTRNEYPISEMELPIRCYGSRTADYSHRTGSFDIGTTAMAPYQKISKYNTRSVAIYRSR